MGLIIKLWLILLAAITASVSEAQSLTGCPEKCGDTDIPYPFGVGVRPGTSQNCFLKESFNVTCQNSTLFTGNLPVSSISLQQGYMDMSMYVSRDCFNKSGGEIEHRASILKTAGFTISSTANKFISVGCDTYSNLNSFQNNRTSVTGCITRCDTIPNEENSQSCHGIGCCQVDVPLGMRNVTYIAYSFNKHQQVFDFNNCSYAFVAKQGWFNFSLDYLSYLPYDKVPLVVDWTVSNGSCEVASTRSDYACTSNTDCVDSKDGFGYNCRCKSGFDGNPYHPDGCHGNYFLPSNIPFLTIYLYMYIQFNYFLPFLFCHGVGLYIPCWYYEMNLQI